MAELLNDVWDDYRNYIGAYVAGATASEYLPVRIVVLIPLFCFLGILIYRHIYRQHP
ncbi:MAG: hypothetical protein Q8R12_00520 [bacterium]|nr:hypothetical protein [bacterium]